MFEISQHTISVLREGEAFATVLTCAWMQGIGGCSCPISLLRPFQRIIQPAKHNCKCCIQHCHQFHNEKERGCEWKGCMSEAHEHAFPSRSPSLAEAPLLVVVSWAALQSCSLFACAPMAFDCNKTGSHKMAHACARCIKTASAREFICVGTISISWCPDTCHVGSKQGAVGICCSSSAEQSRTPVHVLSS